MYSCGVLLIQSPCVCSFVNFVCVCVYEIDIQIDKQAGRYIDDQDKEAKEIERLQKLRGGKWKTKRHIIQ